MNKKLGEISDFVFILGFQLLLALIAIIIIGFGWVSLNVGGLSLLASFIGGAAAGITMYGVIFFSFRLRILSRFKESLSKNARKISLSWSQIIVLSVVVGVAEELLFRGVIQTWIATHSNIYIGIFLASVIFGIAHFSSISYVFLTFAIGAIMGVAYHLSQSIEFVIVWHIVVDIVSMSIYVKYPELLRGKEDKT